jgi:uncharacterized membrane protein YeaQ/YmgE (transglycosylase-associated protein family)
VLILLWIAIGLAAAWAIGALMLGRDRGRSRELTAIAGVMGACVGPLVLQLSDPVIRVTALTGSVAALAGALWLAWIVCVATSGDVAIVSPDKEADMVTYGSARNSLVGELLKDAAAHEAGRFDAIGRRFDSVERDLPRGTAAALTKLRVALSFWDGWIDARNRGWQAGGNIDKGEWPMLARRIASELAQDREISDARVGARFDASTAGATEERVQTLAARLRAV